jgi:hypothetical protein
MRAVFSLMFRARRVQAHLVYEAWPAGESEAGTLTFRAG